MNHEYFKNRIEYREHVGLKQNTDNPFVSPYVLCFWHTSFHAHCLTLLTSVQCNCISAYIVMAMRSNTKEK